MLCCFPGRQNFVEKSISKEGRCTAESKAAFVSSVPSKEQTQVSYTCLSVDSCGQTNLEGVSIGHMTVKKLKSSCQARRGTQSTSLGEILKCVHEKDVLQSSSLAISGVKDIESRQEVSPLYMSFDYVKFALLRWLVEPLEIARCVTEFRMKFVVWLHLPPAESLRPCIWIEV